MSEAELYAQLNPVVCVNILTKCHKNIVDKTAYNKYSVRNDESGHRLTNRLSMHYIELPKFQEGWVSDDDRNNWLTFMKDPKEVTMHSPGNPHIVKAVEKLQWLSQDPETRAAYEARQKALRDRLSEMDFARRSGIEEGLQKGLEQGLEKGREEGLEQGLEKGREEGLEQGLEKGREEQKIMAAKAFLAKGVSLEIIAEALNVSREWLDRAKNT